MDMNTLARAYVNMRTAKRGLDDQIKKIEADMEKVAAFMLAELKAQGAKSINTEAASVQYVKSERFYSTEMPAFRQWVLATPGTIDLFENRLHQGNMKQWLDTYPDKVPPGLQADTKETVKVVAR